MTKSFISNAEFCLVAHDPVAFRRLIRTKILGHGGVLRVGMRRIKVTPVGAPYDPFGVIEELWNSCEQ